MRFEKILWTTVFGLALILQLYSCSAKPEIVHIQEADYVHQHRGESTRIEYFLVKGIWDSQRLSEALDSIACKQVANHIAQNGNLGLEVFVFKAGWQQSEKRMREKVRIPNQYYGYDGFEYFYLYDQVNQRVEKHQIGYFNDGTKDIVCSKI